MQYILITDDLTIIGSESKIREVMTGEMELFSDNKIPKITFEIIKKSENEIKSFIDGKKEILKNTGSLKKSLSKDLKAGKTITVGSDTKYRNSGASTLVHNCIKDRNEAEAISIKQLKVLTNLKTIQIQKPLERMLKAKTVYRNRVADKNEYLYYGKKSESKKITHKMPAIDDNINVGRPLDPDGTTARIHSYMSQILSKDALTLAQVARALGLTKDQVSEPLRRLWDTNRLSRRRNSDDINAVYLYYQFTESIYCGIRKKNIDTNDCNPNMNHEDCKKCKGQ